MHAYLGGCCLLARALVLLFYCSLSLLLCNFGGAGRNEVKLDFNRLRMASVSRVAMNTLMYTICCCCFNIYNRIKNDSSGCNNSNNISLTAPQNVLLLFEIRYFLLFLSLSLTVIIPSAVPFVLLGVVCSFWIFYFLLLRCGLLQKNSMNSK